MSKDDGLRWYQWLQVPVLATALGAYAIADALKSKPPPTAPPKPVKNVEGLAKLLFEKMNVKGLPEYIERFLIRNMKELLEPVNYDNYKNKCAIVSNLFSLYIELLRLPESSITVPFYATLPDLKEDLRNL